MRKNKFRGKTSRGTWFTFTDGSTLRVQFSKYTGGNNIPTYRINLRLNEAQGNAMNYGGELLTVELREREANRINRMVKTAASLANLLLERNNKGTINAFLGTLRKAELLVIDEIGFVPLHKDAAELLFQVISDCYERKSLIITSNLEFS